MTAVPQFDPELQKKVHSCLPPLAPQRDWEKPITPIQKMLFEDQKHKIICITSGRRSRKTVLLTHKGLVRWLSKRGNYYQAAPTFPQVEKIFWERTKNLTRLFWMKDHRGNVRQPSESKHVITLDNGSLIQLVGLEKGMRIEGSQLDGIHISEVDSCKEEIYLHHVRPMLLDTDGYVYLDGVPDGGMGWYYDICLKAGGGVIPERDESIGGSYGESDDGRMAFYNWWSSDVYDEARMEEVLADYAMDQDLFDQEFKGMFIALKGAAYKGYSPLNNMTLEYNPRLPVHIGWDFNRTPMACTFSHVQNDKIFTFGEAVLDDCTTEDMIDHILRDRFRNTPREMLIVYPDASGKQEKSNASKSDIQLIRQAGLRVFAREANPRVKDRLAGQRRLFKDRQGVVRQYVDSQKCKHLVNDFNKVKTDQYGNIDADQKKTRLTHVSDALTYQNDYLFPLQRSKIEAL